MPLATRTMPPMPNGMGPMQFMPMYHPAMMGMQQFGMHRDGGMGGGMGMGHPLHAMGVRFQPLGLPHVPPGYTMVPAPPPPPSVPTPADSYRNGPYGSAGPAATGQTPHRQAVDLSGLASLSAVASVMPAAAAATSVEPLQRQTSNTSQASSVASLATSVGSAFSAPRAAPAPVPNTPAAGSPSTDSLRHGVHKRSSARSASTSGPTTSVPAPATSPVSVQMYQSLPFVRCSQTALYPDVRCLQLFEDGVGLRHFFSGNQRGALFLVVTLETGIPDALPDFPLQRASASGDANECKMSLKCWRDEGNGGASQEEHRLFEFGGCRITDAHTVCIRLNLLPGRDILTSQRVFYFHLRLEYGGTVVAVQTQRMRILSKPRRLMVAGFPGAWDEAAIRSHWPSLQSQDGSSVAANVDAGSVPILRLSGPDTVPFGFEAPLHRALVEAVRNQLPLEADQQVIMLDFDTAARCGHFIDEHLAQVGRDKLFMALVPRRPRPDPSDFLHFCAVCIIRSPGSKPRQYLYKTDAVVGSSHSEALLQDFAMSQKARSTAIVVESAGASPVGVVSTPMHAHVDLAGTWQATLARLAQVSTTRAPSAPAVGAPAVSFSAPLPTPPAVSMAVAPSSMSMAPAPASMNMGPAPSAANGGVLTSALVPLPPTFGNWGGGPQFATPMSMGPWPSPMDMNAALQQQQQFWHLMQAWNGVPGGVPPSAAAAAAAAATAATAAAASKRPMPSVAVSAAALDAYQQQSAAKRHRVMQ